MTYEYNFYNASGTLITVGSLALPIADSEIGRTLFGEVIASASYSDRQVAINRRVDRAREFSETIDMLNPIWYGVLTLDQQTEITAWRILWLDYPDDLTTTRPVRPEGIF